MVRNVRGDHRGAHRPEDETCPDFSFQTSMYNHQLPREGIWVLCKQAFQYIHVNTSISKHRICNCMLVEMVCVSVCVCVCVCSRAHVKCVRAPEFPSHCHQACLGRRMHPGRGGQGESAEGENRERGNRPLLQHRTVACLSSREGSGSACTQCSRTC
jgi:hypothetical protein